MSEVVQVNGRLEAEPHVKLFRGHGVDNYHTKAGPQRFR
jgi:hypothetical protein